MPVFTILHSTLYTQPEWLPGFKEAVCGEGKWVWLQKANTEILVVVELFRILTEVVDTWILKN